MKTDKIDLKKMTKEMIAKKVKSKLEEFYAEDKNNNNNKKIEEIKPKVENYVEDDSSEISEQEEELEIKNTKNSNNNIISQKQTDEINYFSLNMIGIFLGIALIILFFIIRYFCCHK